MPDSFVLTDSAGGTSVELATAVRADPGPDFGAKDLLKAQFVDTPWSEGQLAFEQVGPRRMVFPMLLRGSQYIGNLGLFDQEALLRRLARPGATVDLKPQGATTAVRFDVLTGRYEPDYVVPENREAVRKGNLILDVEPYGYWPTWITLASQLVQNVPLTQFKWGAGSVIGDAPAEVRMSFVPTAISQQPTVSVGTWMPDLVAWSIAPASFNPLLSPLGLGTLDNAYGGSFIAAGNDAQNITATSVERFLNGVTGWTKVARWQRSAPNSYQYGRHRLFAWCKLSPSQALPVQLSADVIDGGDDGHALASSAAVATLAPALASSSGGVGAYGALTDPVYTLVDLGELTLPGVASKPEGMVTLRLWCNITAASTVATPILFTAGFWLHPLEQPNGIWLEGRHVPTHGPQWSFAGQYQIDSSRRTNEIAQVSGNDISTDVRKSGWRGYRGALPYINASTAGINVMTGSRRIGSATAPYSQSGQLAMTWQLAYRPRFQFLKGL